MPLNPILNVYLIELNPIDPDKSTFRDFCRVKFQNGDETSKDEDLHQSLFINFLKEIAGEKLIKDKKSQKVLGVRPEKDKHQNTNIKFHSKSYVIEGIIDGGKYGFTREVADIDNNNERENVSSQKAILDKYYFYLHTPFNSVRGLLFIQSYTEETIQQPFKDFIKRFFSYEGHFYNLNFDNYVPERITKKFQESSDIVMFKYKKIIALGNRLRNGIDSSIEGFEVVLQIKPITPKGRVKPKQKNIMGLTKLLGRKKFEKIPLGENPTIVIKNEDGQAHFDVEDQIRNIKPTIFLKNEGVEINEQTGIPNFDQMKGVCEKLLEEIIKEREQQTRINEI